MERALPAPPMHQTCHKNTISFEPFVYVNYVQLTNNGLLNGIREIDKADILNDDMVVGLI